MDKFHYIINILNTESEKHEKLRAVISQSFEEGTKREKTPLTSQELS